MATPQLEREKWEKLVCAMFTGANVHDRNGDRLVEGRITRSILEKYGPRGTKLTDPNKYYLPRMTALYQEDHRGVIVGKVLDSDWGAHVEKQLIAMSSEHLRTIHSIGISYSPCTDECADAIVERYKDESLPKPVIHFSWVHNHPHRKPHGRDGIKCLIKNGFKLQKWETEKMYEYLLEQAPNETLRCELQQAYTNTTEVLSERDMVTQELIEKAKKIVQQAYENTRIALSKRDVETHKLIEDPWEEVPDDAQRRAHLKRPPPPVEQQTDEGNESDDEDKEESAASSSKIRKS